MFQELWYKYCIKKSAIRGFLSVLFTAFVILTGAVAQQHPSVHKELVIGMSLEPPHLDPTTGAAAAIDQIVYNNIFEGLTTIDRKGKVRPLLADSWRVSEGGRVYVFFLKKGVVFHDLTPFDSKHVLFSLERARAKNSLNPRRNMFQNIDSIAALSPYAVKIILKSPDAQFPYKLALPESIIVSVAGVKNNETHPIGTGPYMFVKRLRGYYVTMKKFPRYKGKNVKIHRVWFRFLPDPTSATTALLSGDVDVFPYFPDTQSVSLFEQNPKFAVRIGTTAGKVLLALNNKHLALKDIRVRRALNYAIDKQDVVSVIERDKAQIIGSHMSPNNPAYIDLSNMYPHDTAKAKSLLEAAHAENLRLKFLVPPKYNLLAQFIAGQLKRVGVATTLQNVDWATWLSKVYRQAKYDITVITHIEPMDYGIYARKNYYFGYNSTEYTNMLAELNKTVDEKKRMSLLHNMQRVLARDAVNVWLYAAPKVGIWNAHVKGMWENAPVESTVLRDVYWQK